MNSVHQPPRPSSRVLATIGVGALFVILSLALAACGTDRSVDAKITIRDTGVTTAYTPPASVPALASGITPEQIGQLLESYSRVPTEDWEIRDWTTLGDWAVTNVYTSQLSEQMEGGGVVAVFQKRSGAWFLAGWVSDRSNQVVELMNMGAPDEVWRYFGLDTASRTAGGAALTERMPDDFDFIASYGLGGGNNAFDTFEGTFTKDLGPTEEPATTKLTLSPEALQSLYQDLCAMQNTWQIFTTGFAPDPEPTNTGTSVYVTPCMTYRLEWQAAGFNSLTIVWQDSALSTALEAAALRAWFKKLQQLIEATPEWQVLPPMVGGYE